MLFLSDRDDRAATADRAPKQAIFLLPLDGGEARRVGNLDGDLSGPQWSPDGHWIAVLREDPKSGPKQGDGPDRDDAYVVGDDPKRTRLWLVDVETGRSRCLTTGHRHVWSFAWVPDGERLVAVTSESPEIDAIFGELDVVSVPAGGGAPHLVCRCTGEPSSPVVVESGNGPLVLLRANDGRADPPDSVWAVPLAGGNPRNLLPGLPGNVVEVMPASSGVASVGVRVTHGVETGLFHLDPTGDAPTLERIPTLAEGGMVAAASFGADGRLAFVWTNGTTPEEVWVADEAGAKPITRFGEAFTDRLHPTETVRWRSVGDVEVEGILTRPAGHDPETPLPLVVHVHGGPFWQWDDRVMLEWHDWAQMLASNGIATLQPNPRGSTGYGAEFQRLLQDDVGGGEAQDLITGAEAMIARGIADAARVGIGGWSWGGYLTAWTITQTPIFRAAVMGAGLANMVSDHGQGDIPTMNLLLYPGHPYREPEAYWKSSPVRFAERVTTPTLILHGDADDRVHPAQGMEYHRALRSLGVPTTFVRYPREGHLIKERQHQIDLMRRVVEWYRRWLVEPGTGANGDETGARPEAQTVD